MSEGESWVEYRIRAVRPRQILMGEVPDVGTELVMERAVNRFVAEHFPEYGRADVTEVVLDYKPVRGGLVEYETRVCYTHVEREQV